MGVQPVVPSNTVRELMPRALPKRKDISHRDVHNVRICVKLLLKDMYAHNKTLETITYDRDTVQGFTRGMDFMTNNIMDKCVDISNAYRFV